MNLTTWWLVALSAAVIVLAVVIALLLTAMDRVRRNARAALLERTESDVQDATTGPLATRGDPSWTSVAEPESPESRAAYLTEPSQRTEVRTGRPDPLAPPPMVGRDTLRDWLIHYRKDGNVWSDVVAEFYNRAAQDPAVADYFGGVDWDHLKKHFMAALVLIAHSGVSHDLPATAARWHADVRNSKGDPITPAIFDATIGVLVGVLRDYDVPEATLEQLGVTVAPFRMAIAREKVQSPEQRARAAWPTWRDQRSPGVTEDR